MSKELATLIAKRFIQRRDVKAIQFDRPTGPFKAGDWFPDIKINPVKRPNSRHLPHGWKMSHLMNHISGEATYGHYLLDPDNNAKLFAFDIDLKKKSKEWSGSYVDFPKFNGNETNEEADKLLQESIILGANPLELWQTRTKAALPARNWYKLQMKTVAHMLTSKIVELGCDSAVAYSGSKGVHVYGFTGSLPAKEVREAALLVLDMLDEFELVRGRNFYQHKNDDPVHGFQNFSIEVFPKQDTLQEEGLGNLMRLPLGVNHKHPKDPTFFLDMTTPLSDFSPHKDPVALLEGGNPFA